MKRIILCIILIACPQLAFADADVPPGACGVFSWGGGESINRKDAPNVIGVPIVMKWRDVEPADGVYKFDRYLGRPLEQLAKDDYYTFIMLWVGFCSPEWLYDNGVPLVVTDRKFSALGKPTTSQSRYPYYFHPRYKYYFHRLIEQWGRYVNDLPDDLQKRIVFLQSAEGATGDGFAYKGTPYEEKYRITREQWGLFRIETWQVFMEHFQTNSDRPIVLLVNNDSNEGPEHDWLFENQSVIATKQGMFSHGYHISSGAERLGAWNELVAEARALGKSTFTRGEMDNELNVMGWSTRNVPQALYWSSLYATHCGLDHWNVPAKNCLEPDCQPALVFFNRYAGHRRPQAAPGAFCALRRGLDAADIDMFPEEKFGELSKRNQDRYTKVAAAFKRYGAYQGDPEAATGGGMLNRKRKDYNDAGWGILTGNYYRFLEQIEPDETSVAWWHKGPSDHLFSRFARGFDHKNAKTAMYFRLDKDFFADSKSVHPVTVSISYLDEGDGQWSLKYATKKGKKTACKVKCKDTGTWQTKQVVLKDAIFNKALPKAADLILEYAGGDDTAFHIIELTRK